MSNEIKEIHNHGSFHVVFARTPQGEWEYSIHEGHCAGAADIDEETCVVRGTIDREGKMTWQSVGGPLIFEPVYAMDGLERTLRFVWSWGTDKTE